MKEVSRNARVLRAPEAQLTGSPEKRSLVKNGRTKAISTTNPFPFGGRFIPSVEENEEFRLTVGSLGKKRRFNVFQEQAEESPGM